MIEAEQAELAASRCIEDVGEGDLHRLDKRRHVRRLDRDVEAVLQHARRQHVLDQFGRDGRDADLHVVDDLTLVVHCAARRDRERQRLALVLAQTRCGLRVVGGDQRRLGRADRLEHAARDARQVGFDPVGIGLTFGIAPHAAHQGVGDAGGELDVHHHFGEEHAGRRVGRGAAVDRHLHVACGHVRQLEVALVVGVDELVFTAEDVDLGMRNRVQEHVVGGVDDAVGTAADVVEGHRLEVGPRINHLADELGADHAGGADGAERGDELAARRAVAVTVEEGTICCGADLRSVKVQRDA